jgi:cold shock CspA family protein
MRQEGILIKWNDERGFGFIRPLSSAEEVFVHVSSFDRNGARPQLNDKLSFEIEAGSNGKKKAVRVMRLMSGRVPESRVAPPRVAAPRPVRRGGWSLWLVVPLLVLFGVLGYRQVMRQGMNQPPPFSVQSVPAPAGLPQPLQAVSPVLPATTFRCDGRQYCSQMTSCDEARFFLRHCPDVKMDGDGDGIPCEDQFCGH